jgi:hypothetical protein
MTEHTELLALILPPQGRLALATADSTGLPGPMLVLALEHKAATGSQTVAGRMDVEQVQLLRDGLDLWLQIARRGDVQMKPDAAAQAVLPALRTLEDVDEHTVATWLASGAEGVDVDTDRKFWGGGGA